MANDLLSSLNAVSRAHSHIVFNESTHKFERAGKRHAIASFFGVPDAKAKNSLTLQKIKEALSAEVSESGSFSGYKNITDGLFASVSVNRRIKSDTINSIIQMFRKEASSASDNLNTMHNYGNITSGNIHQIFEGKTTQINPHNQSIFPKLTSDISEATVRLFEQLTNENEYMIIIESPYIDHVKFYSTVGWANSERPKEAQCHTKDTKEILTMLCGKENQKQVALAMSAMVTLSKNSLLEYAISNNLENHSISFNPLYVISIEDSGDINLKISNLPSSEITLDLTITIKPDGSYTATTPIIGK